MRSSTSRTEKYKAKTDGTISQLHLLRYGKKQKERFKSTIQDQVRIEQIVKDYLSSNNIGSMWTNYYILFAKKCVEIKNKHGGDISQNESLIEKQRWFERGLDEDHLEAIRLIFIQIPIIIPIEEIMSITKYRKVGRYHFSFLAGSTTNLAITANSLYAYPFVVPESQTFDRIAIKVQTLSAGNVRLGIYSDNGTVYPGALLVDAGEVDVGATGVKSLTINQTLTAGLYWLVLVGNSTPTLTGVVSGYSYSCIGSSDLTAASNMYWLAGFPYAALPTPFPAGASGNVLPSNIWLRRA
jgi:hypothetical protein